MPRPEDPQSEPERLLCEMINQLRDQHAKQLQPLYDRLATIRLSRPLPPIVVPASSLSPEMLAHMFQDAT